MGYPKRLLSEGEEIASEFRPHWSGILRELALLLLLGVLLLLLAVNFSVQSWIYIVLVIAGLAFTARGLIRWWTTMHAITNERIIYRAGLISKKGTEIPLEVINDVSFSQSVFERIFGTGDLLIESAGTHGQSRYRDIPRPEKVQSLIYQVREARTLQMRGNVGGGPESAASQLSTLSRLHDEGKLTDEEFAAQKKKLLGGD